MRALFTLLFFCCCFFSTTAQEYFRQSGRQLVTQKDGLGNNTLMEIYQDTEGFIWLGTDIGLSRYDGVHFHNYNLISIEPHGIESIHEMKSKNLLWLKLARHSEIACFDKYKGKYIPLTSPTPDLLQDIKDLSILDSTLFVTTSKGIAKLIITKAENEITLTADYLPDTQKNLKHLFGYKQNLYAVNPNNDIFIYNIKERKGKVLEYSRFSLDKAPIDNIHVYNGYLWISCRWAGLICYDPQTDGIRHIESNADNDNTSLKKIYIKDIVQENDSTLIIASQSIIYKMEFSGTNYMQAPVRITNLEESGLFYDPIVKNRITKLYIDQKNSVLWLGTFGRGFIKLNIKSGNIDRITLNNDIKSVNDLAQDANGYVWLATETSGVYKSDRNKISPATQFIPWDKCDRNSSYCLHKDKNGYLWMGDEKGNILWVNPLTNQTITYHPQIQSDENNIGIVQKLYLNSRNQLWIATSKGLLTYNRQTNECLGYMPFNNEIGEITAMCEDGDGIMWVGTDKGIKSVLQKDFRFELKGGYEKRAGVSEGKVLAVYVNNYNQLFISYADKVIQIDGQKQSINSVMMLQKDFPNGHIECIIDDRSGNTWLGSNTGIITIHNKSNSFYRYALPEKYYDVCRLNDGRLLWSNSTGLLYFDPRIMKENSSKHKLHISDIDVNYKKVEIGEKINGEIILDKPIYQLNQLNLNHANNSLILYLSDLSYSSSDNKIKYRLLPKEKEWNSSYGNQIMLSNIEPGDYTLEIKPSSPSEEINATTLDIHVDKHWATTGWAISAYISIVILIIILTKTYLNHKAFKRQLYKSRAQLLKNKLEQETEIRKEGEKNQQMRDQIRYMLAQELRTPLSLVTAPLKEMVSNPSFPQLFLEKAKVAYRNSISMQDVCNQLLNIHQQESYDSHLNVAPYTASNIADMVVRSSYELLNANPIKLHYDKDNRINMKIWIDRKRIEFVLRNILSNAYRHISYSGNIRFSVSVNTLKGKEYCTFQIEDDGKDTIQESSIHYLSTDNINSPSNLLHPELGIAIMKETALAHHGDIKIEEEKNIGTIVTLYIPTGKEHFEKDTWVSFVDPENINKEETEHNLIITAKDKEAQITEENSLPKPINSPITKYKLLVIEDHKDIRLYLKVLFSSNYTIIMAENGEEGVKMARKETPDIIITDVMMPVMDGFECCRILKEDLKTCHIPIILLTALVGDADVVKGIDLGADDYILKPFNPDILRSKVKRLIKSRIELKQIYTKLLMPSNISDKTSTDDETPTRTEDPFIMQILEIVENNLQNPEFNVKKLAEMLNMSQPTLYRRVKLLTNYTIIELIRGVRLKCSAELLRMKKYSIQEVAEMVGYNDAPTFRKHFVDFYGTTPSTFNNKEVAEDKK